MIADDADGADGIFTAGANRNRPRSRASCSAKSHFYAQPAKESLCATQTAGEFPGVLRPTWAAPRDPLIGQRALPLHTARMLGKKLFHRKRAHANTGRFNDGEMSGPIGPFNDPSGKTGADLRYGRHW